MVGQSKVTVCITLLPGLKVTGVVAAGGRKLAVTWALPPLVSWQEVEVPELAQAPPQPANVEGAVAVATSVTGTGTLPAQLPDVTPFASWQPMPSLSETLPVPVPMSVTESCRNCCAGFTVSVVLESLAVVKLVSPA